MKKLLGICLLVGCLAGALYAFNYLSVGKQVSEVVKSDPRNSGIIIDAHYKLYYQPSVLAINVKSISGDKSTADVFRFLLQYAARLKEKKFDTVLLQSEGKNKFVLQGEYFQSLGREHGSQNPVYTMRTFAENVYTPEGEKAFRNWSGGLLGVVTEQMKDFAEFHKRWYVEDM